MASELASRWIDDHAYSPRLSEADARRIVADAVGLDGDDWARPAGLREFDTWLVDDGWVVRLARRSTDAAKLDRERRLLSRIDLPVQVPRIELWSHGVAVYRMVRGAPAAELAPAEHAWPALAVEVASVLNRLHSTPMDVASEAGLETAVPEAREALQRRLVWALAQLDREPLPSGVASLAAEVAAANEGRAGEVVVCYGDFKAEHVLLSQDGTRLAGIIDWADAELRSRESDFASLVAWLGPRFARLVREHYNDPVDLDTAIVEARTWVVTSLAEAVTGRDDWPAEPGFSAEDRQQAILERRAHWSKAVVAVYDE